MNTISVTGAAVTGARHLRLARNGQDAVAMWASDRAGAIVVCDGCGAAASSEVGARLGAHLMITALANRLAAGARPSSVWAEVRAEVVVALGRLAVPVHEYLLFTIVAAAAREDELSIWAVGDGAYVIGDRVQQLGPFPNNEPPYLAYELLGMPVTAHVEHATLASGQVAVATDGAAELDLPALLDSTGHPDGLRRKLALLARPPERIDWDARRIVRAPAALQDDGAIAVMRWAA